MSAITARDIDVVFFDCDDCLYINGWKTADRITAAIDAYCTKNLGLPEGEAYAIYKRHGTCLKGLVMEGMLDDAGVEDYLERVHDVDHAADIHSDLELAAMLPKVVPRRWVFTASTVQHATKCMVCLGVADLFEGIVDTRTCKLESKYSESAFADAMAAAGVVDPKRCILLDDSVKNIQMAKQVGFVTVLVGKKSRDSGDDIVCAEADFHISKVTELADVIPGIFQSPSPL